MPTLYQQIGGFDKILELTQKWHELCLADPIAAHPFEHGIHPHHNIRLAAYLAEAFAGPALYSAGYGTESMVRQMHACNEIHIELDEHCLKAFDQALAETGITGEAASRASNYFRNATESQCQYATPNSKVPENLPFLFENPTQE